MFDTHVLFSGNNQEGDTFADPIDNNLKRSIRASFKGDRDSFAENPNNRS
jgi:hypothetical protein